MVPRGSNVLWFLSERNQNAGKTIAFWRWNRPAGTFDGPV